MQLQIGRIRRDCNKPNCGFTTTTHSLCLRALLLRVHRSKLYIFFFLNVIYNRDKKEDYSQDIIIAILNPKLNETFVVQQRRLNSKSNQADILK